MYFPIALLCASCQLLETLTAVEGSGKSLKLMALAERIGHRAETKQWPAVTSATTASGLNKTHSAENARK